MSSSNPSNSVDPKDLLPSQADVPNKVENADRKSVDNVGVEPPADSTPASNANPQLQEETPPIAPNGSEPQVNEEVTVVSTDVPPEERIQSDSIKSETGGNVPVEPNEVVQGSRVKVPPVKTLSQLALPYDSDCFVQLLSRERLTTKDGKPYFKAVFRDRTASIQTILWNDNPLFHECEKNWIPGSYYKIRGAIHNSNYGPKLEIRRIRKATIADKRDGFDRNKCRPCSEIPPEALCAEILSLAAAHIGKSPLLRLVQKIFKENRSKLCESQASRFHHRDYVGGLLEHTLSVTKIVIMLSDHFCAIDPFCKKKFSKPLAVAGAILHDIGKLLDSTQSATGSEHTIAGNLIGHAILGAEIVRDYAQQVKLDSEITIHLEHLILTHSRFPDWGAPMQPLTLEAMVVHFADYADSTFASALKLLATDRCSNEFLTMHKGPFGDPLLGLFVNFAVESQQEKEQNATQGLTRTTAWRNVRQSDVDETRETNDEQQQ